MKMISLDANAVLDLCYRFYGTQVFEGLWGNLQACVAANQIRFFITPSIHEEVTSYITLHDLDASIFDKFITEYKVHFPDTDEFGSSTLELKETLLGFRAASRSPHVIRDNYGDSDIVSFAKSLGNNAIVLTSETRSKILNWQNPEHQRHIKVPNLCELFQVECMNWFNLFNYLGHRY
ncbi:hypothetical protein BS636_06275 [Acinetobacter sp. LoGeW2-3]|uniref:DUF4411 family protein n=1 Tax=Acinetobacter sp. LoGeW2-3 TaxID=1808001 RepID=UPI000C05A8EE|nr:DUF4411 family protein [Acinetobacter sp. LoGeW2-3]ATO19297.1 hypothetical protein BS636_06275 [Acinetobacter sp. LoGeW2-3]